MKKKTYSRKSCVTFPLRSKNCWSWMSIVHTEYFLRSYYILSLKAVALQHKVRTEILRIWLWPQVFCSSAIFFRAHRLFHVYSGRNTIIIYQPRTCVSVIPGTRRELHHMCIQALFWRFLNFFPSENYSQQLQCTVQSIHHKGFYWTKTTLYTCTANLVQCICVPWFQKELAIT